MYDRNLAFMTTAETAETKTAGTSASWQLGVGIDFKTTPGTQPRGMKVAIPWSSIVATASATLTNAVQESADSTTWNSLFTDIFTVAIGTVTTQTPWDAPFVMTKRYLRILQTPSNTTSGLVISGYPRVGIASPG